MKIPLIRFGSIPNPWSQKCTGQNRTNAVQINRKFQKKCDLSSGNINSDCQRYQTDLIGIDLAAGSIFFVLFTLFASMFALIFLPLSQFMQKF